MALAQCIVLHSLRQELASDAILFVRQDYVEEVWRIVDSALKDGTPVFEYEPQTSGPQEMERVTPPGRWYTGLGL